MKSSNKWVSTIRTVARTVTVLVLAVIIVGISITPVLAKDDQAYYGQKEYHGKKAYHGHGRYYGHGGYYYPAPVYAPPPPVVYYAPPPPPPGITFVFPINIR